MRGAYIAFFLKTLGAAFSYLFAVVIARTLNASGVGTFFLALTIVTIASTVSRFGLENASLKYVAINANNNNWAAIKGLHKKSMRIVLYISLFLSFILWNTSEYISYVIFSDPSLIQPLKWMSLMITPHALFWLQAEFFKGLLKITYSQLLQGTALPFLAFTGVLFFRNSIGVLEVAIIYVISTFITCMYGHFVWLKVTPEIKKIKIGFFPTKKLVSCSFPLYIGSIMNLIILWSATLILGIFENNIEIGIFSVAQRTATLISFILIAVNSISAPKFATLYSTSDIEGLAKTARYSAKLMTFAASPLILICVFKANWVMNMFGPDFAEGATLLAILAIGQFINVLTGSVGFLLMMSGNEKSQRNNLIFSAILHILLCMILIPLMGSLGAAISTATTMSVTNLIAAFLVYKKLNIITLPIKFGHIK